MRNEAEQYIHENHRFERFISAVNLRVGLQRQKGHCTWCNKEIHKSMRHCSDACRDEVYIRNGMSFKSIVYRRDAGICARCGSNLPALQQRFKKLLNKSKGVGGRTFPHSFARLRKLGRIYNLMPPSTPYEIDHIIPVVEGGGCCGLDNLQTLCIPCHREDTKRLAARRATERRDAKRLLLQ